MPGRKRPHSPESMLPPRRSQRSIHDADKRVSYSSNYHPADEILRPTFARAQRHAMGKYSQLQDVDLDDENAMAARTVAPQSRKQLSPRRKSKKAVPSDDEAVTDEDLASCSGTIAVDSAVKPRPHSRVPKYTGEIQRPSYTKPVVSVWKRVYVSFDQYCHVYREAWEQSVGKETVIERVERFQHEYKQAWLSLPGAINIPDDTESEGDDDDEQADPLPFPNEVPESSNISHSEAEDPEDQLPRRVSPSLNSSRSVRDGDLSSEVIDIANTRSSRSSSELPGLLPENVAFEDIAAVRVDGHVHNHHPSGSRSSPLQILSDAAINACESETTCDESQLVQAKHESQADSQVNPFSTAPLLGFPSLEFTGPGTIDPRRITLAPSSGTGVEDLTAIQRPSTAERQWIAINKKR